MNFYKDRANSSTNPAEDVQAEEREIKSAMRELLNALEAADHQLTQLEGRLVSVTASRQEIGTPIGSSPDRMTKFASDIDVAATRLRVIEGRVAYLNDNVQL